MNELGSLGLILLLALVAGHLVQYLRIPEVTGYILAGIALGPSFLGWVSHENLDTLQVLSEVALGLILLSVGSVFQASRMARVGHRALRLALSESLAAFTLVTMGALAFGQSWQVALLLGVVAMETAPASTLMVLREMNSEGPLTEALLGIIAVNNLLCLTMYTLVSSIIALTAGGGESATLVGAVLGTAHSILWQIVGSAALGFLVGILVAGWAARLSEPNELVLLLAGGVLVCLGVSRYLDLSSLVASLALGGTIINLTKRSQSVFNALAQTDPPFYAIFFVMAGADLDAQMVPTMGLFGVYYLLARGGGKILGATLGSRRLKVEPSLQRYLGLALLAHAGLAVGIVLNVSRRFPELGATVSTVVLSAVVIYEIVGPIAAKFAVVRSGETKKLGIDTRFQERESIPS